jgi:uncharacterized protein YjbI with pentapeptide repeats
MKRLLIAATLLLPHATASADIFQWEYIDPAHPELGKQESTVLCPDGAGVVANISASLDNRDLTKAYMSDLSLSYATFANSNLSQAYLAGSRLGDAILTNANLSQADLSFASFWGAPLTGADLSGAHIRGALLYNTTSQPVISNAQLFSTASYQEGDLRDIQFHFYNLDDIDFAGMNLSRAGFSYASMINANLQSVNMQEGGANNSNLTGANLSQADLRYFSFVEVDLTGANLHSADLRGTHFFNSNLTGVDFSASNIRGARFAFSLVTTEQFTSPASYQARDLQGIQLHFGELSGINLSRQNLSDSDLYGTNFTGADLSGANLQRALVQYANFSGANLNATDLRGLNEFGATFSGAITYNAIHPDGEIFGLGLGDLFPVWLPRDLVVRDIVPLPWPGSIYVTQQFRVMPGGTLRLVFDDDGWGSLISLFTSDIELGGTLELTFAPDVDVASQVGMTFDLFDWNGHYSESAGMFHVVSPYKWDLSKLYTTGEVRLLGVPEPGFGPFVVLCFGALLVQRSFGYRGRTSARA